VAETESFDVPSVTRSVAGDAVEAVEAVERSAEARAATRRARREGGARATAAAGEAVTANMWTRAGRCEDAGSDDVTHLVAFLGSLWRAFPRGATEKVRFSGRTLCTFDAARGMASGFDTRVSSNSSPTGISKGAGALGRGVTFTVTYAGC
jgi:hypothetical protein